jgi:hypothetical protein
MIWSRLCASGIGRRRINRQRAGYSRVRSSTVAGLSWPRRSCGTMSFRLRENWHHKANRLAYFSSHLFDAASIYRCRAEDHARAAGPFDNSCDSRHIHAGSHNGKAKCAGGSCRALVPRKNAGDVSSAWKNSISCTYFVPFCAHTKMEHFR